MTELCFSVKSSSHGLYESHDSCRFSLGIVHSRFIQWNDELLGFGSPSGLRREVAMIQYQSAWCPYCEVLSIGVFRTRRGFGWLRRKLCIHLVRILYYFDKIIQMPYLAFLFFTFRILNFFYFVQVFDLE